MCWEMDERAYLGRGQASMAWEMSWERVVEVARERRRREKGSEDVIVAVEGRWMGLGWWVMRLGRWLLRDEGWSGRTQDGGCDS